MILNNNCIDKYRYVFVGGGGGPLKHVLTSLRRGESVETHVGRRVRERKPIKVDGYIILYTYTATATTHDDYNNNIIL